MVNSLCSWIKRRLRRFPGMRPEHLQDNLDWCVYLFRVKRDNERWPKLEGVARRLVMTDATYSRSRGQSRHPFGLLVDLYKTTRQQQVRRYDANKTLEPRL